MDFPAEGKQPHAILRPLFRSQAAVKVTQGCISHDICRASKLGLGLPDLAGCGPKLSQSCACRVFKAVGSFEAVEPCQQWRYSQRYSQMFCKRTHLQFERYP